MVFVKLKALECIKTGTGELEEEPYLNIFVHSPTGSVYPYTWGPVNMHTGDTHHIGSTPPHHELPYIWHREDGLELEGSVIGIYLREKDTPVELQPGNVGRQDDNLGGLTIIDPRAIVPEDLRIGETLTREGAYEVFLPYRPGMVGGGTIRRYKLYYDVYFNQNSPVQPTTPYSLQLECIECHDAQEYADEVFIKVNGEKVWGDRRMQTGDVLNLRDMDPIPIGGNTMITLWEKDTTSRNDFFGEFRLRVEDADVGPGTHWPRIMEFHPDLAVGSARYTIQYTVRRTS